MPEPTDDEHVWADEAAGPVVRHYAMTAGRTRPTRGEFDLITQIVSARPIGAADTGLQPEHASIVRLCRRPVSVAELATALDLPVGTVRVLLGDLLDRGYIKTRAPLPAVDVPDVQIYKAVLDGLRSL